MILPQNIKNRGRLFLFDHSNSEFKIPTYVFLLEGKETIYLCDTHISEKSIERVKNFILENYPKKEIIVFNSHSHFDHVWGNSAFKNSKIISHQKCFEFLSNNNIWNFMINESSCKTETVEKALPQITFSDELKFELDRLLFFYSPGHSIDSASCFDQEEKILFTGDNIELPLPYLDWHHLDEYLKTLQKYIDLKPEVIITSHNGAIESSEIEKNIQYISDFKNMKNPDYLNSDSLRIHELNKKTVLLSKYEEEYQIKFGDNFNVVPLFKILKEKKNSSLEAFETSLKDYLNSLNLLN